MSHSDRAGTDDVFRCLLQPWLSTPTVLFLHLGFVDLTCVLYVSILSKWIPRYPRILHWRRLLELLVLLLCCWGCTTGFAHYLDWFRTLSLGTNVTHFPTAPGQRWLLCGCHWYVVLSISPSSASASTRSDPPVHLHRHCRGMETRWSLVEVPLSVVGAWRSSFKVTWQPFFPGVLLRAILCKSSWHHIAQGVPSAGWIALGCTHLQEFVPSSGNPSLTSYANLAAFSPGVGLFSALYSLCFGGSTFLHQSPEQTSRPQSFHQLSRGVLLCEDTVSVQLAMVLSRFWDWLEVTMWPILGKLACYKAFFVQSGELALVIYWQVLDVWVFDLVRTSSCILAQSWQQCFGKFQFEPLEAFPDCFPFIQIVLIILLDGALE